MEIATPVCGLARNDREFDKFPFIRFLRNTRELNIHFSAGDDTALAFFSRFGIIAFGPDGKKSGFSEWENPSGTKPP